MFSATAYHWVSEGAQLERPATILRHGGIIAIVELVQVDGPEDQGFFAVVQPIYERYGEGHTGSAAPTREDVDPPVRRALEADDRFRDVQLRRYDWDQTYSAADFRTLMLSYSGTQMMDEADRTGLLDDTRVVRARAVRGQRHPTARRGPDHAHPFLMIRDGAGLAPQSPVRRYSRIMPSIQVKDVPDDVHAILEESRPAAARDVAAGVPARSPHR